MKYPLSVLRLGRSWWECGVGRRAFAPIERVNDAGVLDDPNQLRTYRRERNNIIGRKLDAPDAL